GRAFRMLVVLDEFTRRCLAIVVERKLRADDVLHCLADLFAALGPPEHIRSDNGPEFAAIAVRDWLGRIGVKTLYIEPGSPRAYGAPPLGRRPGVRGHSGTGLAGRHRREDALHRAGQPMGERLLREPELEAQGRAAEW